MPTRIIVDADNFIGESGASTAQTADMNWVSNEFVSYKNEEKSGSLEKKEDFSLNDTTLSGSMLLEALQEFESIRNKRGGDQPCHTRKQLASLSPSLTEDRKTTLAEKIVNTRSLELNEASEAITPPSKVFIRKHPRLRSRQPGPNEQEYIRTYHDFVKKAIGDYNRNGKSLNYRDMDETSKDTERIFVLGLLKRLHIQDVPCSSGSDDFSATFIHQNTLGDSLQGMDETLDLTEKLRADSLGNDPVPESYPRHSTTQSCLQNIAIGQKQSGSFQIERSAHVTSPIEIARSNAPFDSPIFLYQGQKRTATSSGKRGADIARTRHERPSEIFGELNLYDQPSEIAESSFHDLSLSERNSFLGSESPLSQCSSTLLNVSSASSPGMHDDVSDEKMLDDSLSGTPSQKSLLLPENRILQEVSLNPSLKDGKTVQYKPLQVNFEKKGQGRCLTQSVPDPFDGYRNSTKAKLVRIVKWIRKRDAKIRGKGLILSLSDQQVIDVILNILKDKPPEEGSQRERVGGTLIVLRSTEDAETWCRALREGCTLSVLNHPAMPRSERISPNVAIAKLTSYSIIITTFDALKAGDATIACDSNGVAMIFKSSSQSDWQKSRSSDEVRQCKEMSLIHHLKWQRVFFVDALGKKCFLVKRGTARVTSARALNSDSRFVFVTGPNDGKPSLSLLMKSNKNAAEALSSVIHLGNGDATASSIGDVVADLNSDDTLK